MKARPSKHQGEVLLELNRGDESLLAAAGGSSAESLFRLKRILVPMDFSDCARKALRYAIPLARQHQAALTLLYVSPRPNYVADQYTGIDCATLEADLRASGEKQLCSMVVDEVQAKVPAHTVARIGAPVAEILDVAKELPADLIVISTHGRTGLKHVLMGSVAEDVVQRAPCPVLVVREHEHEFLAD